MIGGSSDPGGGSPQTTLNHPDKDTSELEAGSESHAAVGKSHPIMAAKPKAAILWCVSIDIIAFIAFNDRIGVIGDCAQISSCPKAHLILIVLPVFALLVSSISTMTLPLSTIAPR